VKGIFCQIYNALVYGCGRWCCMP